MSSSVQNIKQFCIRHRQMYTLIFLYCYVEVHCVQQSYCVVDCRNVTQILYMYTYSIISYVLSPLVNPLTLYYTVSHFSYIVIYCQIIESCYHYFIIILVYPNCTSHESQSFIINLQMICRYVFFLCMSRLIHCHVHVLSHQLILC